MRYVAKYSANHDIRCNIKEISKGKKNFELETAKGIVDSQKIV